MFRALNSGGAYITGEPHSPCDRIDKMEQLRFRGRWVVVCKTKKKTKRNTSHMLKCKKRTTKPEVEITKSFRFILLVLTGLAVRSTTERILRYVVLACRSESECESESESECECECYGSLSDHV